MEDLLKEILEEIKSLKHQSLVYTTKELADELHTSSDKIDLLRRAGAIKGIKKGKGFIFTIEEVKDFLERFKGADLSNHESIKRALIERL